MKVARSILLIAAMAFGAPAADVAGVWKAVFTGPIDQRPRLTEITFELNAAGGKLTGIAHMSNCPGDAPLTDGNIEADRISFTVVGKSPWQAWNGLGYEASGLPKLTFAGTIHGGEMHLKLIWDNVMLYGNSPAVKTYEMNARKSSD